MFDIGWGEMLVIAIVVLLVVGPKELPGMLRTFGKTTAKLRAMAGDFRKQFDEALKEAELDDLKKIADDARKLNPANEIKKALSPMEKAAHDVRAGLDKAMNPTKPAVSAAEKAVAADAAAAQTTAAKATAAKAPAVKPAAAKPAKKASNGAAKTAPAPKAKAAPKPKATPARTSPSMKKSTTAAKPKAGGAES